MSETRLLVQAGIVVWCAIFAVMALDGGGPYVWLGQWLNRRARRKTLRLLATVAFWAAEPEMCE